MLFAVSTSVPCTQDGVTSWIYSYAIPQNHKTVLTIPHSCSFPVSVTMTFSS